MRVVERARIVLLAAYRPTGQGHLSMAPKKVSRWRTRFLALGVAGLLKDAPRPGRKPTISARLTQRVVDLDHTPAAQQRHALEHAHYGGGCRYQRSQRAPHMARPRFETASRGNVKISNDPAFAEKLEDIVGLYLNPPEHALVLCVDEKSQIQALDLTQPGLPLKRGRGAVMTHDYKRNGTATLFAALNAANGEVYGLCQQRHRHQEWLEFLRLLDQSMPAHLALHLIGDNYATHKHHKVQRWLARHPRFHMHFTPTSASWLNMEERFFRDLTQNRLRRVSFAIWKS
jgi:transposase